MGLMEELNDRIKERIPAMIFKAIQPTFGWDTVVNYVQHCADNGLGEPVDILNYKLPVADQIDSIRPVTEYLSEHIQAEIVGTDLYTTLTTKGDIVYKSNYDMLLWNVIGYSGLSLMGEDRQVEPGDLIYIPKNTEYLFKPLVARAYVVFSLSGGEDGNKAL